MSHPAARNRLEPRNRASDLAIGPPVVAWLALTVLTVAGWLAGQAGLRLTTGVPRDALPERASTVLELLVANAPVASWPLALIALGWPRLAGARRAGDVLVAAQLVGHGLLVGTALGQQPDLWHFLAHLPLEWAAIAVPAGAWLATRTHPTAARTDPSDLIRSALTCLVLLTAAAVVETYAVPI